MKQKRNKLRRKLLNFLLALAMVVGLMPWTSLTAYAVETDLTMDDLVRAVGDENFSWNSADYKTSHSIWVNNGVVKLMVFQEGSSGRNYNAKILAYNRIEGKYYIAFDGWDTTYFLVLNNSNYITSFVKSNDESHALTGTSENPFEKSVTNYTVTYKVENGTWDGTSTADKTETVASGGNPASVPTGMKANSGYTGGSWDKDPASTTITADTIFTYTFVAKEAATVIKAPTANTLTYNGSAQELVTAGTATGGEMQYALGTATEATQPYTTSIPAKTDAGTYYVWYKVAGNSDHSDTDPECVEVVIRTQEGAIVITTQSLPSGKEGNGYKAGLKADKDGAGWSIEGGALPAGLSLNGDTGEITGTPEKTGEFSFTVKASKDGVSASKTFQIKIAGRDEGDKPEDDSGEEKNKEEDHTPPSWVLNPNEKQALGITYTGLAPGTTAGYQEQGEAAEALLAAAIPDGWKKAFSFSLLNGGKPDQTLKCGTLSMFIHPEWQKEGRQYAMLSLDRYGKVAFLPDTDTDPLRCTVNVNFEGYAMVFLYKDL